MTHHAISRPPSRAPRFTTALASALVLTAVIGCASDPASSQVATDARLSTRSVQAQLDADLKTARQATSRFHSFELAKREGYTFLFMDMCMVDQSGQNRGGMGYHYVNPNLLGGTNPEIAKPQAVLYEPAANGSLKLVGLEYVVPADQWTSAQPPRLFGRDFVLNSFNLWALHVWLYEENPSGMFADWNPSVSCANAG